MKKKINILLKMFMALSIIVWSIVSSLATSNTAKAKDAHAQQNRIERVKTDLDLSKLQLYQFSLKQENMQIINRGDSVIQGIVEPNTDSSGRKWTKSTVFLMKIDKSKGRQEQVFSNPLKLKFFNAGTVNGKQVDVYIDILEARFIRSSNDNGGGDAAFKDSSKTAVPFLTVDENWGQKSIQIQDYIWPNHPNLKYSLERAFNISVATKVTYKYADGTPMDLKVVMQPSDIDVTNSNTGVKEKFWLSQPETKIDKLVMNNANKLTELQEGGWTYWEHSRNITTEEKWKEHNETGFAVRSIDNTIQFSYTSAAVSGGLFGFYTELPEKAPKKTVDQETIPAEKDQEITYTGKFTSPRPGIDVIGDLRSLKMSDTFDERLDFKSLDVKLEGRTLTFEKDYSISKNGQTVVVEIINKELLGRSSQGKEYEIKYHTKTNDKIKNSGKDIQNRVTMIVDNVELHSNYVKTELLYKQTHEFKSLVPNKDLPKEVIDLTPGAVKGLKNGTVAKPVMPTKTSVVTTDGIWEFKNYDQNQKVVKGADVHFIGYWNFTPHTQPKKEVYTGNTTTNIDGQEVKAGQELTYAITYQNTTGEDRDVTVTDKIPAYTTFVSAEDGGRNENGTVTWNRNVKNGESFTFKFKVKVNGDVNGNKVDNVAKVNNGKNEYTTNETHNPTNPEPKKEVYTGNTTTNIDGQEVKAGQELTYAITYQNTTGEDRDVTVTDKIPAYTTFVSAEDGGRNENGTVTWNRNVKNGESFTFKFKVKVNDDVNGQRIDNVAKVNNGKNEYTTNETHNPTNPEPKKEVYTGNTTTNIDGQEVKAGQELTYAITYQNTTGEDRDVTVTDKIPAYTTFVSAEDGGRNENGTVTWNRNVKNGESFTFKFKVKVNGDVNGNKVDNVAKVNNGKNEYTTNETHNPTNPEPKKEVYTGNTTTNIDGQEVKAGQELTYAITYQNTTGEDRDVTVTDKIPAYTTFVSAEDGGRNENGTVTWNRNVKNGESFTFKFKVKVNGDVNGNKVDNVAKVNNGKNEYTTNETHNPTNPEPKKEVYTGNTTTNIDGQEVKAGQELTYAITYQNTTGEDRDVTVTDKIPAYTTFVSAEDGGRNENGTVTWNRNVKNGESFTFKFKVKVNGDVNGNKVDNVAKVNNGKNEYTTNETHNPTNPEPKKEVYTGNTTTNIDGQEVKAGQELTYAITYQNTTGEDRDVTVTDKIPAYTTFVSAEDGGRNENGTVTWNRNVKNGESFTFKFKVKVNDDVNGQRIDNVAKVNNGKNEYTTNETHNPTPPTPPVTPPDNPSVPNEPNNNSPLPNTGLAGIDVTGLGVVLAALGTVLYYRKRKN